MTASRLSVLWFLHMKRSACVSECRALTCALRNVSSLASFQSDVTTCFACTALNSTHTINTVVNNRKEITQNLRFITRYFQFNIVDKLCTTDEFKTSNERAFTMRELSCRTRVWRRSVSQPLRNVVSKRAAN